MSVDFYDFLSKYELWESLQVSCHPRKPKHSRFSAEISGCCLKDGPKQLEIQGWGSRPEEAVFSYTVKIKNRALIFSGSNLLDTEIEVPDLFYTLRPRTEFITLKAQDFLTAELMRGLRAEDEIAAEKILKRKAWEYCLNQKFTQAEILLFVRYAAKNIKVLGQKNRNYIHPNYSAVRNKALFFIQGIFQEESYLANREAYLNEEILESLSLEQKELFFEYLSEQFRSFLEPFLKEVQNAFEKFRE